MSGRRRRRRSINEYLRESIITIRLIITIVVYCFLLYATVRILLYLLRLF